MIKRGATSWISPCSNLENNKSALSTYCSSFRYSLATTFASTTSCSTTVFYFTLSKLPGYGRGCKRSNVQFLVHISGLLQSSTACFQFFLCWLRPLACSQIVKSRLRMFRQAYLPSSDCRWQLYCISVEHYRPLAVKRGLRHLLSGLPLIESRCPSSYIKTQVWGGKNIIRYGCRLDFHRWN